MVNADLFSRLVPLHSLLHGDQGTLAKQSSVLSYRAGQVAFSRGELVRNQAYLVSGEIELQGESSNMIMRATGENAVYLLTTEGPRGQAPDPSCFEVHGRAEATPTLTSGGRDGA